MWATPLPFDPSAGSGDRMARRVDLAFSVFAVGLLYTMFVLPGYETVPYHILFVSFAAVYGFRIWSLRVTVAVLGGMVVSTGAVLVDHWAEGELPTDELFEIVLMPLILGAMVWHARRRAAAQRALEQLAQQERDRRLREHEFARDTSHALRTPLTIARGHIELIRDSGGGDPALLREDADVALNELDRIGRMASRLLAIAELERPDALALRPVDVAAMVGETYRRWSAAVERQWSLDAPPVLHAVVDDDVLRVVLDAMVENAVRVTDVDDRITLTCGLDGGFFVVAVADSGPGIDPDETRLVFQRFWRNAGRREGTGLGLSYVRAAADAHGGSAFARQSAYGGALVGCRCPVVPPAGGVHPDRVHSSVAPHS